MTTTLPRPPRTATAVLALPAAATLLALMNYTAPIATLHGTATALGAGAGGTIWILSAVNLGLAAALLPAGSLADDHGRRRVFVLGALLLAATSLLCAAAPDVVWYSAGRIGQGAASAALLAAGLGVIGASAHGEQRARGTTLWGAMLGLGIALGPLAAAVLDAAGWRLWYVVTALAALALAAVARRTLPESRAAHRRGLDVPGVLTLAGGSAALLTAVTLGRTGWRAPGVAVAFALAALLLAAFTVIELRRARPMLDPRLLRRPLFLLSVTGAFVVGVGVIGGMSLLAPVLDQGLGLSTLGAALLFTVWSGVSFVAALGVRRLPPHWHPGSLLALALALSGIGTLALLGLDAGTRWWTLVPGLVIAGVGSGVGNAMLARLALEGVPPEQAGMGSGAANTARYVGASVGVAVMIAIASAAGGDDPAGLLRGTPVALGVGGVLCLLGAGLALVVRRVPR
ncbi:MFS transporter [Actinomadura flavalba]|uniref:MFS transporter n=1 Tax=Actinomadura flavalba TaxID=1120938 RepID=UPI00036F54E1|nr:MFS transporter [Actinomadura flavalba]